MNTNNFDLAPPRPPLSPRFANFFMNLATVWPYRASRRRAYLASVVAMSVSHVVGAYVARVTRPPSRVADEAEPPPRPLSSSLRYVTYLTFVSRDAEDSTAFFALFAVAACALMYLRQDLNWRNYRTVCARDGGSEGKAD